MGGPEKDRFVVVLVCCLSAEAVHSAPPLLPFLPLPRPDISSQLKLRKKQKKLQESVERIHFAVRSGQVLQFNVALHNADDQRQSLRSPL